MSICQIECCGREVHGKDLCRTHYMRQWRYGDARHISDKVRWREAGNKLLDRCKTAEAFEPGECWPWSGAMRPNGYGTKRKYGTSLAHRVAWIEAFGLIEDVMLDVCHRCDNRPCVRPSHLFLGTRAENVADMLQKGREARNYGDDHHHIKLTDAQVGEIRALLSQGVSQASLARQFGVNSSHINRIAHLRARVVPGATEREADRIHATRGDRP